MMAASKITLYITRSVNGLTGMDSAMYSIIRTGTMSNYNK